MKHKNARWPYSLRDSELFADCNDDELDRIGPLLTELRLEAGKVLLREGSWDRQFMVIAEGHVAVTSGVDRRLLAEVGPGSFVGEMSLIDDVPRSATVTAVTPLAVYACNDREFDALLASSPSVRSRIVAASSKRRSSLAGVAA